MKISVIPFSNILSLSIEQYIKDNEQSFIKDENRYILTIPFKINILNQLLHDTTTSIIAQNECNALYIVNECYPYNNWRMQLEYSKIVNGRKAILDKKTPIKYILKERDIKIDELRLNHIADMFFIKNFKKCNYNKTIFLKHRNLTEEDFLYIFNTLYSKDVLNISLNNNPNILKINDLIYVSKSDQLNKKYIDIIISILEHNI